MFRRAAAALALPVILFASQPAQAATEKYRVALRGFPVGMMTVTDQRGGNGVYDAKSHFKTTGLAGVVREVYFTMQSRGRHKGASLYPVHFVEDMNTGKRKSNGKVQFNGGDARWDPNTAMIAVLADRPVAQGCAFDESVFDGKRTHQLKIWTVSESEGQLNCKGTFTRTAGYTAKQLSSRMGYTFTISYNNQGGTWVFNEAATDTDYGRVNLYAR
ncbi:MAG TPA: hypothetical protein DEO85_08720 [Maritimibacter sp.]|nr:hypothetical protein [Maritimibacter sp.]